MIGIVIPLKAKKVSEEWSFTSSLLDQTLDSLRNQTSQDFKAVVVGHDEPELSPENEALINFVKCSFDLRKVNHTGEITHYLQIDRILDKYRKIGAGLKFLESLECEYFMVLDADDLLHKDLIAFVNKDKNPNGYILDQGYELYSNFRKVIFRNDMAGICGSTTIIHKKHVPIPAKSADSELRAIPWCFLSHSHMRSFFQDKNTPLVDIPFPGLIYKLGHGQNASNEFRKGFIKKVKLFAKMFLKGRNINTELLRDFGINKEKV